MKTTNLKFIGFVIALVCLTVFIFMSQPDTVTRVKAQVIPSDPQIAELYRLLNQDREASGVPPLNYSLELEESANDRCNDMVNNNYFSHTSPTGKKAWDFIQKYTNYETAAENLGRNFKSMERLEKAWMNSPKHREAILDLRYSKVGLAVCESDTSLATMHLTK